MHISSIDIYMHWLAQQNCFGCVGKFVKEYKTQVKHMPVKSPKKLQVMPRYTEMQKMRRSKTSMMRKSVSRMEFGARSSSSRRIGTGAFVGCLDESGKIRSLAAEPAIQMDSTYH
jgi:hypothetical protein